MSCRDNHTLTRIVIGAIAALGLAGCSSASSEADSTPPSPVVTTTPPAAHLVDVAEGQALVADPSVVVVDVRTPDEFAQGHLQRAGQVDLSAADFRDRIAQLDRSTTYFVYCHSGNRSAQATAIMAELGFTKVYELRGGIAAWVNAGAPVVT